MQKAEIIMALKRASIIKQTEGGQCVCSDNYTGNNCETAPAGESCGETMCSVSQHCENDTCVCNEGTFTCDPDTSSVNACCAEGYYCGSENEDDTEYKCLDEQACPEDCSNITSLTTDTLSVQYCAVSEDDCYHVKSTSCDSITVTCGIDDASKSEKPTNRKYCYNTHISWWDAKSICKALGMRLPTVDELVTGWTNTSSSDYESLTPTQFAQNMYSISDSKLEYVWSSNLYNACEAWYVYLNSGFTSNYGRNFGYYQLLCVQ